MEVADIQSWLFQVKPLEGESLSHFLGRFRRANDVTPTRLGKAAGLGGAIARWEKFRFNPPPSQHQLEALATGGFKMDEKLHKPGEITPTSGQYEITGSRGGSKGHEITSTKGNPLAPTPESNQRYRLVDPTKHKNQ